LLKPFWRAPERDMAKLYNHSLLFFMLQIVEVRRSRIPGDNHFSLGCHLVQGEAFSASASLNDFSATAPPVAANPKTILVRYRAFRAVDRPREKSFHD
jgi:hypothetical protein